MTIANHSLMIHLFGGEKSFNGVLLTKDRTQQISDLVSTPLEWWVSRYDERGWFATPGDSFVTVPAGVRFVRLSAGCQYGSEDGTERYLSFRKNSAGVPGFGGTRLTNEASPMAIVSPVIQVVAGDSLTANVFHDFSPSIQVDSSNATYFGVEEVR